MAKQYRLFFLVPTFGPQVRGDVRVEHQERVGAWRSGTDGYYLWVDADDAHFIAKTNELAAQNLRGAAGTSATPGSGCCASRTERHGLRSARPPRRVGSGCT